MNFESFSYTESPWRALKLPPTTLNTWLVMGVSVVHSWVQVHVRLHRYFWVFVDHRLWLSVRKTLATDLLEKSHFEHFSELLSGWYQFTLSAVVQKRGYFLTASPTLSRGKWFSFYSRLGEI